MIVVLTRFRSTTQDWEAWAKGFETYLGVGKTQEEAVGDLLVNNQLMFKDVVLIKEL